jgi:hypothetical protein
MEVYTVRSLPLITRNNVPSKYTIRSLPPDAESEETSSQTPNINLPPDNETDVKTLFELNIKLLEEGIENTFQISSLGSKRPHPSGFSEIVNYEQLHIISNLIAEWDLKEAIGTCKEKTIICAKDIPYLKNDFGNNKFFMSGRIDLQGRDSRAINNKRFERYAIQMREKQFATVHIEVGKRFSVRYIRRAFWVSIIISEDVWIGDDFPQLPNNVPGTWDSYSKWSQNLKQLLKNLELRRNSL